MKKRKEFLTRALSMTVACAVPLGMCPMNVLAADGDVQSAEYVYGTVNLPYADYYYGELNAVAENAVMDLTATDKVAALREAGQYDAVTSATKSKYKNFSITYTQENEDPSTGGQILGIKDVTIAVPKSLYDSAKNAIQNNETCNNKLLEIVGAMQVTDTTPEEYKVLNGDGTLTEMKDAKETVVVSDAQVTITNSSRYGNYQLGVPTGEAVTRDNMEGVILETASGKKYGMKHLENLWFKTGEVSFAAEAGFIESHGNLLTYERYEDIQGETITSITYIVRGGADVTYEVSLLCKKLLSDNQGYACADEVTYAEAAKMTMQDTTPEGSNYALATVTYGGKTLTAGTDYEYDATTNVLTLHKTGNTGAGTYTLKYTSDNYEDFSTTVVFASTLKENEISIVDNKLKITNADVDVKSYLASISSISVDGSALKGSNLGTVVFTEDGSVNFDAAITSKKGSTVVFPEKGKTYSLKVTAPGYPTKTYSVTSPAAEVETPQVTQKPQATQTPQATEAPQATQKPQETQTPQATQTPKPTEAPKATETPSATVAPSTSVIVPSVVTQPTVTTLPETTAALALKVNQKTKVSGVTYKVTATSGTPTVTYVGTTSKKAKITIPSKVTINGVTCKVTAISAKAFKNNKKVTTVTIPNTVKTIGANAFQGCTKLKKVSIPKNVTSIGKNAFKGAKNLKSITISAKNIKKINSGAFKNINKKAVIKISGKMTKKQKAALVKKIKNSGVAKTVTIK